MISFEFPVTERTRTLLRLEQLYDRLAYFLGKDHALDHHAALLVLFELLETAPRATTQGALQDRDIEVVERREVPVVDKQARVVEEVVVQRQTRDRIEKVADTVRETRVEVEEGGAPSTTPRRGWTPSWSSSESLSTTRRVSRRGASSPTSVNTLRL